MAAIHELFQIFPNTFRALLVLSRKLHHFVLVDLSDAKICFPADLLPPIGKSLAAGIVVLYLIKCNRVDRSELFYS